MALPKISAPIFTTTLPSTGEKINYRPFTVKEEKILLIAREASDPEQIITSVKQILNNCLIGLDVEKLPTFDVEWLLIHIRAASVDNTVMFKIKDPDTQEYVELEMNIDDAKMHHNPEHTNKIKADDTYTIIMRYPTIEESIRLINILGENSRLQKALDEAPEGAEREAAQKAYSDFTKRRVKLEFDITISCMDKLVSEDEVFNLHESTPDEINAFVDSLDGKAIAHIKKFFETMPILRHEIKYTNKKGDEKTFVVQGLNSFFT